MPTLILSISNIENYQKSYIYLTNFSKRNYLRLEYNDSERDVCVYNHTKCSPKAPCKAASCTQVISLSFDFSLRLAQSVLERKHKQFTVAHKRDTKPLWLSLDALYIP